MYFAFTGDITTDVGPMFQPALAAVMTALNERFESSNYAPIHRMLVGAIIMAPGAREIREAKAYRRKQGDVEVTLRLDHGLFKSGDEIRRRQMLFGLVLACIAANRRALEAAATKSTDRLEADLMEFGKEKGWHIET